MTHKEVFKHFKNLMPFYHEKSITWYQNGKNSIRVEMDNGERFIFTFNNKRDWRFETVDSFVKNMKGGKK